MIGHRMRELYAPRGLADTIVITCECGWQKRFTLLSAAQAAHERHAALEQARHRRTEASR